MKGVCDLLARFQKLRVLNLTKLGPWVAEICISLKITLSYCIVKEKINIVLLYCENFKGANPYG